MERRFRNAALGTLGFTEYSVAGTAKDFINDAPASGFQLTSAHVSGRSSIGFVAVGDVAWRYRSDGTAPTATRGIPVAAGNALEFDGPIGNFKFISQAGTATIAVEFYA